MVYLLVFGSPVLADMHFNERDWRSSEQEY
jgi:hypothetical protein